MMNRNRAILAVFAKRLAIKTDEEWLKYLDKADTSSISRYRRGTRNIPESVISELCELVQIERFQFDLPVREIAKLLNVVEKLPQDVLNVDGAYLKSDQELISRIKNNCFVVFPGRDHEDDDEDVIWFDEYKSGDDNRTNCRELYQVKNTVLNESFRGRISSFQGIIYISVEYPGLNYPPSHYLFEPIFSNDSLLICSGIYTDVMGGAKSRIFSTQCCLISVEKEVSLPRIIKENSEIYTNWKYALDNKINHRDKLLSKKDESDVDYIKK